MYFMGNMEIKQNYKDNLKIMKEVCVWNLHGSIQ